MFALSWIRRLFARTIRTIRRGPIRRRRRPALEVLEDRVLLSYFNVIELTDTKPTTGGDGSGNSGDLRYCINQASANPQANTIQFDPLLFATSQTIDLAAPLVLSNPLGTQTITGPDAGVTISGINTPTNLLVVAANTTASLSEVNFIYGDNIALSHNVGGAITNNGNLTLNDCTITHSLANKGGAIYNTGTLALNFCTVSDNEAFYDGGALFSERGTASLVACTVSGNEANFGAGFYNLGGSQLSLTGCTLSGNVAGFVRTSGSGSPGDGGGIRNQGAVDLTNCAIEDSAGRNGAGVYNEGTAALTNCDIINNNGGSFTGQYDADGAGLFNLGSMTVTGSQVSGNTVTQSGGGIYDGGDLTLTGSTLSGNLAKTNGGGIDLESGVLTLTNCSVSNNQAFQDGGGICNFFPSSTMRDCTISGNRATLGGGLVGNLGNILNSTFSFNHATSRGGGLYGSGNLTNCTVYDNTAYLVTKQLDGSSTYTPGTGGGIFDSGVLLGSAVLTNCTLIKNQANRLASRTGYAGGHGGDVYNFSRLTLNNCLVAGSTAFGGDIVGSVSGNSNLVDDSTAAAGITGKKRSSPFDQLDLGVLTFNGGTTKTVAPDSSNSPVLGAGDPSLIPAGVTTDQRGASRTRNGKVDIGAVESNANIIVTTLTDEDNGGPDPVLGTGTSLREAIEFANLDPSANDLITFAPGLTGTLSLPLGPLPAINANMTIVGPGANLVTINAVGYKNILSIPSGVDATVAGLTLKGAGVGGGGLGAVANAGTLEMFGCTITGNQAVDGGGVYNSGTLTLYDCTISGNQAAPASLGLNILESGGFGGGVYSIGLLALVNSTVSGNTAFAGGGIFVGDSSPGPATVTNCTIAGNAAFVFGGGIVGSQTSPGATLDNTIVAENGGGDVQAKVSGSYNLIDDAASAGDFGSVLTNSIDANIVGVNAKLGPLQYNGGTVQTMAPLANSPAINGGSNALIPSGVTFDERVAPRIKDSYVDIGAIETGVAVLTVTTLDDSDQAGTLRAAIDYANTIDPSDPVTITFASNVVGTLKLTDGALPTIAGDVAIVGPGANNLTITGPGDDNILSVQQGGIAAIGGLTLADSSSSAAGVGGAVTNSGSLIIQNCTIAGCSGLNGGGIVNNGALELSDCTISNNTATDCGGGLSNDGSAILTNCTVTQNTANGIDGGGIFNAGAGLLLLTNCTVVANTAVTGGGVANDASHAVSINNSIVCSSTEGGDLFGPVFANHTWIGDRSDSLVSGPDNLIGEGSAPLATLGYYGGATETMPIIAACLAIGGGSSTLVPHGVVFDQRGVSRFHNGAVDMGACESGPATIIVTTLADVDNGSIDPLGGSGTSLREAINFANADIAQGGFGDTITFSPLLKGTIDLTLGALPTITSAVTIQGPGANVVTIDAQGNSGIFAVGPHAYLALSGLTLTNGSAANGGAILNNGSTLTLSDCTLSGNTATSGNGGAIDNNNGTLELTGCTLEKNNAANFGGGVCSLGALTLTNSTLFENTAGFLGGGIFSYYAPSSMSLFACTVVDNSARIGSGIHCGSATLTNTIVAENGAGDDIFGSASGFNNLIDDAGSAGGIKGGVDGNLTGVDPTLGPLAFNGGQTPTLALLPGSPAIGAGTGPNILLGITTDQRGLPLDSPKPDIGAFQYEGTPPTVTISGPTTGTVQIQATFTITATDPTPKDQKGTFTYTIDWNGNGSDIQTIQGPAKMQVTHAYAAAGSYTPRVIALDQDFRSSAPSSLAVPVQVAPLTQANFITTVAATNAVTFSVSTTNQQLAAQNQINLAPPSVWKGAGVSLQVESATPVADVVIQPAPQATVNVSGPPESPIATLLDYTNPFGGGTQQENDVLQIVAGVSVLVATIVVGALTFGGADIGLGADVAEIADVVPELSSVATPLQQPLAAVTEVAEVEPELDASVANEFGTIEVAQADPELNVEVVTIIIDGDSPALTVGQGTVTTSNALMGTSTDSSTVLLKGGTLNLTENDITGNPQGSQPLIEVDGGTLILGSPDGTNANTLVTYGSASFVQVASTGMVIVEPGNVFAQITNAGIAQAAGTSSVQLVSSAPYATPDQTVTFTASITAGGASATSGSVEFFDNTTGVILGTEPVINGSASVQTSYNALTSGDTIYATYLPTSSSFAPSSGHLTQVVATATTTTLTGPASTPTYGQSVTLTATVTSTGGGVPTGSVEFYDGSTDLGPGTMLSASGNSSATSTFTTTALAGVLHQIQAVYMPSGNFQQTSDTLQLTVAKATLLVSANLASKTYGQAFNPINFSGTVSGVQNQDPITVTFSSTGDPASADATSYAISAVLSDGSSGKLAQDYTVLSNLSNVGTLIVNKAMLTVSAHPASKTYGQTFDPASFHGKIKGIQNGDAIVASYTSNGDVATAGVANYSISAMLSDGGSGKLAQDYTVQSNLSNVGTLTVNKANLTITALDQTKVPRAAIPPLFVLYSGFVLSQGPGVLGGTLKVSTTATTGSPHGTYPITLTPVGLTSGNYAFQLVPGQLTVLSPSQVTAERIAGQLGRDVKTRSYVNFSQATNNLIAQVSAAGLDPATQAALDGDLQAALAAFNQGGPTAGAAQLKVFLTYVKAHRGNTLSTMLADALTAYAQEIIDAV